MTSYILSGYCLARSGYHCVCRPLAGKLAAMIQEMSIGLFDGIIHLFHERHHIIAIRIYGRTYREGDGAWSDFHPVFREYLPGANDCHGHYGRSRFECKVESAFLERILD